MTEDTDPTDEERRSGHDRRKHRFLPELSEQHRQWLTTGAFIVATAAVVTWYNDVIAMPGELRELQAQVVGIDNKVDALDDKLDDTNTEVRIIKETGVGKAEVQALSSSVDGLKVAVEGLTQIVTGLDYRVQRLEDE